MKYLKLFEEFNEIIVYHGTDNKHEFNNRGNITDGTFFSTSLNEAKSYGKFIYEIILKNDLKLCDTTKLKDCEEIIKNCAPLYDTYYDENDELYNIETAEQLYNMNDNWEPIENTYGVLDWLKSNYDGVWIYEGGVKNLLLFSPLKDKIIDIKLIENISENRKNNYDYIIKVLCGEQYGWGNIIRNEINTFENSPDYQEGINDNDYIMCFNKYLNEKFKGGSKIDKSEVIVKQPLDFFTKITNL